MNDLVGEYSDMQSQLSAMTKERDDLVATVQELRSEITQLLCLKIPLSEIEESQDQGTKMLEVKPSEMDKELVKGQAVGNEPNNEQTGEREENQPHTPNTEIDFNEISPTQWTIEETEKGIVEEEVTQEEVDGTTQDEQEKLIGGRMKEEFFPLQKFHNFKCDMCPYKSNKHQLERHVKAVHIKGDGKFKYFKCGQCDHASPFRNALLRHVKAVHEKIKDHICREGCGYAATEPSTLKRHICPLKVKREKNIKCDQCSFATADKSTLKRHVKAIHDKIRDHICKECGFAAAERNNLNRHIKRMHDDVRKSLEEKNNKYGI